MINSRRMWQPLTATPFLATAAHHEILPCESLQGWIRCFWGGIAGAGASPTRIIPDVCADLIYHIDETAGRIIQASFCGVSDVCGTAHLPMIPGHTVSTFAIRFHAFGAYAFADDALRGSLNGSESPEVRFGRLDRALRARLPELRGLSARTAYAQSVLLAFQAGKIRWWRRRRMCCCAIAGRRRSARGRTSCSSAAVSWSAFWASTGG